MVARSAVAGLLFFAMQVMLSRNEAWPPGDEVALKGIAPTHSHGPFETQQFIVHPNLFSRKVLADRTRFTLEDHMDLYTVKEQMEEAWRRSSSERKSPVLSEPTDELPRDDGVDILQLRAPPTYDFPPEEVTLDGQLSREETEEEEALKDSIGETGRREKRGTPRKEDGRRAGPPRKEEARRAGPPRKEEGKRTGLPEISAKERKERQEILGRKQRQVESQLKLMKYQFELDAARERRRQDAEKMFEGHTEELEQVVEEFKDLKTRLRQGSEELEELGEELGTTGELDRYLEREKADESKRREEEERQEEEERRERERELDPEFQEQQRRAAEERQAKREQAERAQEAQKQEALRLEREKERELRHQREEAKRQREKQKRDEQREIEREAQQFRDEKRREEERLEAERLAEEQRRLAEEQAKRDEEERKKEAARLKREQEREARRRREEAKRELQREAERQRQEAEQLKREEEERLRQELEARKVAEQAELDRLQALAVVQAKIEEIQRQDAIKAAERAQAAKLVEDDLYQEWVNKTKTDAKEKRVEQFVSHLSAFEFDKRVVKKLEEMEQEKEKQQKMFEFKRQEEESYRKWKQEQGLA